MKEFVVMTAHLEGLTVYCIFVLSFQYYFEDCKVTIGKVIDYYNEFVHNGIVPDEVVNFCLSIRIREVELEKGFNPITGRDFVRVWKKNPKSQPVYLEEG